MPTVCRPVTEPEILLEVLAGAERELPREVAQWILTLQFSDAQQARMLDLADRGNAGTLSAAEKEEIQNFARAGDTIRLRFALGTDACGGVGGWYVDDVDVFSCTPSSVEVAVDDARFPELDAGVTARSVAIQLSAPTIRPIVVAYALVDGTARHGNDFEAGATGTVVVPAGSTTAEIAVGVKGDAKAEGDEVFFVKLTGTSFGTITDGEAQVTIVDDDQP